MELKEYPYLEHTIKEGFDVCTISDVMSSPVVTFNGVETAGHVEYILKNTTHEGFPVLDQETRQYVGVVRRDQLVACMECGVYVETLAADMEQNLYVDVNQEKQLENVNFVLAESNLGNSQSLDKSGTTHNVHNTHSWLEDNIMRGGSAVASSADSLPHSGIVDRRSVVEYNREGNLVVNLSSEEQLLHLDIAAVMNMGAYTVTQNCPLSKAYVLFAAMGLRHLPVLGRDGNVVGMVSRSNFLPEYMEERTGLEMHD